MYVIIKTCTGNSGKTFTKILTGKSRIGAEFTRMCDAVNVMTWKTEAGARRFMDERSTFKSGHEATGDLVWISGYDKRSGALVVPPVSDDERADVMAMHAAETRAENAWLTHAESGDFYDDPRGE